MENCFRNRKNLIYVTLFCLFLCVNFWGGWSACVDQLIDTLSLRTEIPVYLTIFQVWFFDIIGMLFESIIICCIVGIFSYHFRNYKPFHYLVFGVIARYFLVFFWLTLYLYKKPFATLVPEFESIADLRFYAFLLINFILTLIASYAGYYIALQFDYYDDKDKELGYLYGIPKKVWVLLIIAFNPVVDFLLKYTIANLYQLSVHISSLDYWKNVFSNIFSQEKLECGFFCLIYLILSIPILWFIAGGIFLYGLTVINNKFDKFRYLKIIFIFLIIPGLLIFIPIYRNRTWFF